MKLRRCFESLSEKSFPQKKVRNYVNWQNTTSREGSRDMKIEDKWFLKGLWRPYKVEKFNFKFQGIARWKSAKKRDENCKIRTRDATWCSPTHKPCTPCALDSHHGCLMHPCASCHAPCAGKMCCFACFQVVQGGKVLVFFYWTLNNDVM